jgi:hypothetical protein
MHPEIAKILVAQHRDELLQDSASRHRSGRRRFPRWHVSWTRTVLVRLSRRARRTRTAPAVSAGAVRPW